MISGNIVERIAVGGELVTKKIDSIIEAGKEKIKKLKKVEIGELALINTVIGFNMSAEPLNMPKEYSENITVKGQEKDVFDYDFNSDVSMRKLLFRFTQIKVEKKF